MTGKIILLNGPSSAGKSTLAARLQALLDEPFWCLSIDHLRAAQVLPARRIETGEFPWSSLRASFFDGFHRCLPALAGAGNNLVVEHIIETREWMDRLLDLLADIDVFFVGLHCPVDELERREIARGDRRIGEARADFETAHRGCTYDMEVDSTAPIEVTAAAIVQAWTRRGAPGAFREMARRRGA